MGKFDFGAAQEKAEKEGLISGGYLKLKEGANRMRVVSEAIPHPSEFTDQKTGKTTKTFKWLLYVIDRVDGTVKPFFMAPTIARMIADLQRSDDYGFDSVPMPYDITVNAKNAGKMTVEYTVMAARQNTPLTLAEEAAVGTAKPLHEFQQTIYEKSGVPASTRAASPFDPDDIPA